MIHGAYKPVYMWSKFFLRANGLTDRGIPWGPRGPKKEYNIDLSQKNIHKKQAKQRPRNAASECMELMTGLVHPYNLTYVRCCQVFDKIFIPLHHKQGTLTRSQMSDQVAVESCLLEGQLRQALDWCDLLAATVRKLARWIAYLQKFLVFVSMWNLGTAKPTRNW